MGQGRETAKQFLRENEEIFSSLKEQIVNGVVSPKALKNDEILD